MFNFEIYMYYLWQIFLKKHCLLKKKKRKWEYQFITSKLLHVRYLLSYFPIGVFNNKIKFCSF